MRDGAGTEVVGGKDLRRFSGAVEFRRLISALTWSVRDFIIVPFYTVPIAPL